MRGLYLVALALCIPAVGQTFTSGVSISAGAGVGSFPSPVFVGGQVSVPAVSANGRYYIRVGKNNLVWLMNFGPTSDPNAGMWSANASACELSPSTCTWTSWGSLEPVTGSNYTQLEEIVDVDATHFLAIFSFVANGGACTDCSIQLIDTTALTFTQITLPSNGHANQSPACMARDNAGIFYTLYNQTGGLYESTNNAGTAFSLVVSDYTTLPGIPPNVGNIYNCKVLGNRLYFGGEGGVISCNLTFTSCSNDFLPTGPTAQRNFNLILADVDEGDGNTPTLMLEASKQDNSVTGYVFLSRFASGTWTQGTTALGISQFYDLSAFYETQGFSYGVGTARRYYVAAHPSSNIPIVYRSTTSAASSFAAYVPSQWPATSSRLPQTIAVNTANGHIWASFGTSGVFVTQ